MQGHRGQSCQFMLFRCDSPNFVQRCERGEIGKMWRASKGGDA